AHVQADVCVQGDRFEHVAGEAPGEVAPDEVVFLTRRLPAVHDVGPPGEVDDRLRQRLVQANERVAVPCHPAPGPHGLAQGLPDGDRNVSHRVGGADVRVPLGADGEVDEGVLTEGGEHVVVEGHTGGDLGAAPPVQVEFHEHFGFARVAFHRGG